MGGFGDHDLEARAYALAIDAALAASRRVLTFWNNPANPAFDPSEINEITGKAGVGNFATLADRESEAILLAAIAADPILGGFEVISEESGAKPGATGWRWVLDPIDGTVPFRNGAPEFGVAVGLLRENRPSIGVIAMPTLQQAVAARRGHGAILLSFDGQRLLDLSGPERPLDVPLDEALVGFDTGYELRAAQFRDLAARIADQVGYLVSYCSPATAGFRMALGQMSGYVFQRPTIYDIGALAAIVQEIGGVLTDLYGQQIDWSAEQRSVLAARTPEIHARLLDLLTG